MLSYKEVKCLNVITRVKPLIFTTSSGKSHTLFCFLFSRLITTVINSSSKQQIERLGG